MRLCFIMGLKVHHVILCFASLYYNYLCTQERHDIAEILLMLALNASELINVLKTSVKGRQ
jgi:hypothetical protein